VDLGGGFVIHSMPHRSRRTEGSGDDFEKRKLSGQWSTVWKKKWGGGLLGGGKFHLSPTSKNRVKERKGKGVISGIQKACSGLKKKRKKPSMPFLCPGWKNEERWKKSP